MQKGEAQMFARGISILISSALDTGNIPAPRPADALADSCARDAMASLQGDVECMSLSARLENPAAYQKLQEKRRSMLESFLWIEPNAAILERMLDLICAICEENSWSASGAAFDDPAHPEIDLQAAYTGALFAWILRRHGPRLSESCPRILSAMLGEVRRRLLSPILIHDDYPFLSGRGRCPAMLLGDLLTCCVLMEKNPARRQQPVKLILRVLDEICARKSNPRAPLADRVADACAIADLCRLMKRLTRGEFDLTHSMPPEGWLDDILIPWIQDEIFFDPAGEGLKPEISGMDLFRLGYLTRDKALCALGAQLHQFNSRPAFGLNGRILSMEYMRAAQDELSPPPRLKRAAAENGSLMLSRIDSMFAAISGSGNRANAGDIILFAGKTPILTDVGGAVHSLPLIGGCMPDLKPRRLPPTDADFGPERDLMSVDLTEIYPEKCMLAAYQRTLMTLRSDSTVRLVDAFEFARIPREITFRFVTALRPLPLRDKVLLGSVTLSWDGEMVPEVSEIEPGAWLLSFSMAEPPRRFICGFTFENN